MFWHLIENGPIPVRGDVPSAPAQEPPTILAQRLIKRFAQYKKIQEKSSRKCRSHSWRSKKRASKDFANLSLRRW
jgi:hypothetical protein